jgi:hypothetical protein
LGSRYGECPLPSFLDEAEFTHIRNEAFEGGKGEYHLFSQIINVTKIYEDEIFSKFAM